MSKVIIIHANCWDPVAKGDFAFAGNIAKDLVYELQRNRRDIDVVLVSTLEGVSRFESLYGVAVNGRVSVENTSIGLSSIETFDAIQNKVVAFIDANRCKSTAANLVKRILSPDSKFLFIGNINEKESFSNFVEKNIYLESIKQEQPDVYNYFSDEDILVGSAGFSSNRLGITTITKAKNLPDLSISDKDKIPQVEYGFMYVNSVIGNAYQSIIQYIKLSGHTQYMLVGNFLANQGDIERAYASESDFSSDKKPFPKIQYHQELPNVVMRQAAAHVSGPLVLSTGVTSTLEAMQDGKLTYYQDMSNNEEFICAYLIAVKSIVSNSSYLCDSMPQMIIELSKLLFSHKPLSSLNMEKTHHLLKLFPIQSELVNTNQAIIAQANGKIAPRILKFLGKERKTKNFEQLAAVCISLRKSNEKDTPMHDEALRRAAFLGRLFELKVLIQSMPPSYLNKTDFTYQRTALHWAVLNNHLDCVRALLEAGATLALQDKNGQTALHIAIKNNDKSMIEMLIRAGDAIDTLDANNNTPKNCTSDNELLLFIKKLPW